MIVAEATPGTLEVRCRNNACPTYERTGQRRHIGERSEYGGGAWQCSGCRKWTTIAPPAGVTLTIRSGGS